MVLVGLHAAKYIANNVVFAVGARLLPAKYVFPVPSAFVFQPAKVKPDFAKFPELLATVTVSPFIELALAGTVPVPVLAL